MREQVHFTEEDLFWIGVVSMDQQSFCLALLKKEIAVDKGLNVKGYTDEFYERMVRSGKKIKNIA